MTSMGGYQDYYKENLDEYEDDEVEGEGYEGYEGYVDEYEEGYEEAQEEDAKPSKEVQDYLVLRQRLKDEKRRQMMKDSEIVCAGSREKRNPVLKSNDNYGSFFGSSQPVIAPRVIQESKSLLENPHLLEKVTKAKSMVAKSTVPDSGNSKPQATSQAPKVINGVAKKVQLIRKIRDYSFLDSDDPEPQKAPPPKPEARMAHSSERNKDLSSSNGRTAVPNHRDDRRSTPVNGQTRPNVGSLKQPLSDPRKHLPGSNGTVAHDRNRLPSKVSNGTQVAAHDRSRIPNKVSNGTVAPNRDRIPSKISSGPGRPMVSKSAPPSKSLGSDKRVSLPAAMSSLSLAHKTAPSRPQPSGSKPQQHMRQQVPLSKQTVRRPEELRKREPVSGRHEEDLRKQKMLPPRQAEELARQKMLARQAALRHAEYRKQPQVVPPRQGAPGLKPKVAQPPPRSSVRPMGVDDRARKRKPFDDEDDADAEAMALLRSITGYNPSKFRDDDDTRDMEAGWRDIEREEKYSAKIARQEDEEERLKIEEEERRELMRREAKKRKLQ